MSRPTISLIDALAAGCPLTKEQVAQFLQVSTRQVERLMREGLPHFLAGKRHPRFDVEAVKGWLYTKRPALQQISAGLHPKEQRANRLH